MTFPNSAAGASVVSLFTAEGAGFANGSMTKGYTMLKKIVAVGLLVAALGAAASTVALAACPFFGARPESEWAMYALE